MSTGMGVVNPKFSKSGRKPKKTRHCTNPKKFLQGKEKQKWDFSLKDVKLRICSIYIKDKFGGIYFSKISRK